MWGVVTACIRRDPPLALGNPAIRRVREGVAVAQGLRLVLESVILVEEEATIVFAEHRAVKFAFAWWR